MFPNTQDSFFSPRPWACLSIKATPNSLAHKHHSFSEHKKWEWSGDTEICSPQVRHEDINNSVKDTMSGKPTTRRKRYGPKETKPGLV